MKYLIFVLSFIILSYSANYPAKKIASDTYCFVDNKNEYHVFKISHDTLFITNKNQIDTIRIKHENISK